MDQSSDARQMVWMINSKSLSPDRHLLLQSYVALNAVDSELTEWNHNSDHHELRLSIFREVLGPVIPYFISFTPQLDDRCNYVG